MNKFSLFFVFCFIGSVIGAGNFLIIADAGSSGTKLFAFRDSGNCRNGNGDCTGGFKVKPTMGDVTDMATYAATIKGKIDEVIPSGATSTTLLAYATAGNRIISVSKDTQVWSSFSSQMSTAGRAFDEAQTIPGTKEAYFEFAATNFDDHGHLLDPNSNVIFSFLSSGGASAQGGMIIMPGQEFFYDVVELFWSQGGVQELSCYGNDGYKHFMDVKYVTGSNKGQSVFTGAPNKDQYDSACMGSIKCAYLWSFLGGNQCTIGGWHRFAGINEIKTAIKALIAVPHSGLTNGHSDFEKVRAVSRQDVQYMMIFDMIKNNAGSFHEYQKSFHALGVLGANFKDIDDEWVARDELAAMGLVYAVSLEKAFLGIDDSEDGYDVYGTYWDAGTPNSHFSDGNPLFRRQPGRAVDWSDGLAKEQGMTIACGFDKTSGKCDIALAQHLLLEDSLDDLENMINKLL